MDILPARRHASCVAISSSDRQPLSITGEMPEYEARADSGFAPNGCPSGVRRQRVTGRKEAPPADQGALHLAQLEAWTEHGIDRHGNEI